MADIPGTSGPDTLDGTGESDSISGEGGNDTLTGNGGADTLRGGEGDDVLTAGDDNAFNDLDGGDGNDSITVTTGDAFIQPGAGDDTITGSTGDNEFNEIVYVYDARNANPAPTNGIVVMYNGEGSGTVTDYAGGTDIFSNIDVVRGTQLADSFTGSDGRDRFSGLDGNDTFDGGSGFDEIDYWWSRFADGEAGVTVNLADGTATDPFGDTDTLIRIEDIRGTDFADTLIGDEEDNQLRGGEGDDSISGGGGDDDLRGGKGNDTVEGGDGRDDLRGGEGDDILDGGAGDRDEARYDNTPGAITGNLTTGTVTDGWGDTDTLIGIEDIRGGDFDDVLFGATGSESRIAGGAGNDRLTGADDDFFTDFSGGDGDDTLDAGTGGAFVSPGTGDDAIIGGTEEEGFYELSYIFDTFYSDPGTPVSGITATFTSERAGTVIDYNGDTDTFVGIDRIRGTNEADSFTGSEGEQRFRGFGGDDFFDGGAGDRDEIDYSRADEELGASQGVVVIMSTGTSTDAYGDTDTFQNIERIRGSIFDDQITGDAGDNFLRGQSGVDSLIGGAGDDSLSGGEGNDDLDGGDGFDQTIIDGPHTSYTISIGPDGTTIGDRRNDGEGIDEIQNIEALYSNENDIFLVIDGFENLPNLTSDAFEELIELYIAYFNRAPDAFGLYFWGTAVLNNIPLDDIAALFIDQDETRATYPDTLSNADFAMAVYANVLGRVADQDGFDFWVNALDSGAVGRDVFIREILKGAKADPQLGATQEFNDQQLVDRQYLSDKTDVGAYFSVHKGMSDVDNASVVMGLFDGTDNSISQAVAAIDAFHADALDAATGEFLMPLLGVIDDPFAVT